MCRWIAYRGETITLERYVTAPAHSLVVQSIRSLEAAGPTNGDGFGLGWYDQFDREPGLYREVRPAWSDENLRHLCRHIRSHLFFAHVRASTGTPTTRPNCHPFAYGRYLFMHNGQIGDWSLIRRRVEALIPDTLYKARIGTTDSEAVFLAILGAGGDTDPVGATMRTLTTLTDMVRASGTKEPLRFTAAFADGETLYAFRYSNNDTPNTLYYREAQDNVVIVSEPLDTRTRVLEPGAAGASHHRAPARAGGDAAVPRSGAGGGGVVLGGPSRHLGQIAERSDQRNGRLCIPIVEYLSVRAPDPRLRARNNACTELRRDRDNGSDTSGAELGALRYRNLKRKYRRGREHDRGSKQQAAHGVSSDWGAVHGALPDAVQWAGKMIWNASSGTRYRRRISSSRARTGRWRCCRSPKWRGWRRSSARGGPDSGDLGQIAERSDERNGRLFIPIVEYLPVRAPDPRL